jgi:hypothetical protein
MLAVVVVAADVYLAMLSPLLMTPSAFLFQLQEIVSVYLLRRVFHFLMDKKRKTVRKPWYALEDFNVL